MPAIIRNGHIYSASPAFPINAENVNYDNTDSELTADDVQDAIDELKDLIDQSGGTDTTYTLSVGTGTDANKIVLTPSTGTADKITVPYATNAGTVNGNTVETSVPADAVFTDTTYENATTATDGLMSSTDKGKVDALGTASTKNVPTSGNASTTEIVMGDDTRLTDARNAADVSAWAKASTKPTYTASEVGAIASTLKGANNGVAELDSTGKVPSSQLPSYVDDVLEYNNKSSFPSTGESGKIYIAKDTNKTYRWSGSAYVEISESLALGETSSTAYRGDRGKTAYDHSQLTSGNPHNVSKSDVGLGNVTNDKQVKGLSFGTTENHVVTFGTDGYTVKDSGYTISKSVPSGAVFTDTTDAASLTYSNTTSGLSATKVQGAIDELSSEKKDEYTTITYDQWQQLTPTQKAEKDYYISDYPTSPVAAGNISYSNTSSGMTADDVQGAVDELASEKKDEYTTITYQQWQTLTPAQKSAKDYYISDYPSSAITAGNVNYNNTTSGISANNVQGAVDELKSGLTNKISIATISTSNIAFPFTPSDDGIYVLSYSATAAGGGTVKTEVTKDSNGYMWFESQHSAQWGINTVLIPMHAGHTYDVSFSGSGNGTRNGNYSKYLH